MKRNFVITVLALTVTGCAYVNPVLHRGSKNPYERPIFYTQYLDPANPADQRIHQDLVLLRADPKSAPLHNDLGQLLAKKGFPKDAEREFGRAVDSDSHFYPAWYNLGLMRVARGDSVGARWAFSRALHYRPGYSEALFQMGLVEEQRKNNDAAVDYYAKAFLINKDLLDVRVNPRIVDSRLVQIALIKAYPKEHARESLQLLGPPSDYGRKRFAPEALPATPPPAGQVQETPKTTSPKPPAQ